MSFQSKRIRQEPRFPWRKILAVSRRAVLPLLARIAITLRESKTSERSRATWHHWTQHLTTITVSVVIVGVISSVVLLALARLEQMSLPTLLQVTGAPLLSDEEGFTNLLLLGQGDADHDGIDLTDAILVASVDPETETIVLLSLPRDLYFLKTARMGAGRLNALYRDERGQLRSQGLPLEEASRRALLELQHEVGRALGLSIHYTVKVDFVAFEKAVDALSGIDVVVPSTIDDPEYPGPNYSYEVFHIDAGPQHLDGATALKYARSRHGNGGGDFDRSRRQQQILSALLERAKASGFLRKVAALRSLLDILAEHTEMTLSSTEAISLASLVRGLKREDILTFQLNNVNGLYDEPVAEGGLLYTPPRDLFDGASILLPISIPEFPITWRQVELFADLIFRHRDLYLPPAGGTLSDPRSGGESKGPPAIRVLNAGAREGSARRLAAELTRFGFAIAEVGNTEGPDLPSSTISAPPDSTVATFLSGTLSIPLIPPTSEGLAPSEEPERSEGDESREPALSLSKEPALSLSKEPALSLSKGALTITLGVDYRFVPLQDLLRREEDQ